MKRVYLLSFVRARESAKNGRSVACGVLSFEGSDRKSRAGLFLMRSEKLEEGYELDIERIHVRPGFSYS